MIHGNFLESTEKIIKLDYDHSAVHSFIYLLYTGQVLHPSSYSAYFELLELGELYLDSGGKSPTLKNILTKTLLDDIISHIGETNAFNILFYCRKYNLKESTKKKIMNALKTFLYQNNEIMIDLYFQLKDDDKESDDSLMKFAVVEQFVKNYRKECVMIPLLKDSAGDSILHNDQLLALAPDGLDLESIETTDKFIVVRKSPDEIVLIFLD
ncbi:MAG: hypothetical protein Hyperionvirus7_4 [Hyperionvirus sp.]|uniref:BTB domain-containing protein n=1 Tax=Hyperionvirus sp. TaxID=2487770 RepID=A0A3G5AC36_9VIRU|nr:MAG: hypothetical protein Hyperionvirus7_4 [Hyperionvirus sp.]